MPPTLVSNHEHSYLHQLPRLKEFGYGFEKHGRSPQSSYEALSGRGPQTFHNYSTPPHHPDDRVASAMSTLPQKAALTGSWPARPTTTAASGSHPYPTPLGESVNHSRNNSRAEPFYTKYFSAKPHQSPPSKKENEQKENLSSQRRTSDGGNSIATHLQIPSSINDSKGSLPEFAAQVRPHIVRS